MSHKAQTSFYFLSLMCIKRARVRVFCLFLNRAHASAKSKLWRYFLRQTFYTDEGVIPETSDNFTLKFDTRNIHFLVLIISYEYHAAKNLFCNILARSGFRDFALFLVFWKMFLVFWECSGFLGVPWCSGVPGSTTCPNPGGGNTRLPCMSTHL